MQRFFLIILILFFFKISFSQRKIDFGELPGIDTISCTAITLWPVKPLIPIEESKNNLEIRINLASGFSPRFLLILSFDDNVWQLIKVTPAYDSVSQTIYDTIKNISQAGLEKNFNDLKRNKIFSLPGFYCLNLEGTVDDGILGFIEIKAGDFFRKYDYNNPCSYLRMNKAVEELKYLCNVISLFENMAYGNSQIKSGKGKRKTN